MRTLFDAYAIVDWSAANKPVTGKDSIWLAFAERDGEGNTVIETHNPATRLAAMAELRNFLKTRADAGKRVFAGFDFAFGYPLGAAGAITGTAEWSALWDYFGEVVRDLADNTNNRFEVAGRLNREKLADAPMFWGRPQFQEVPGLSPTRPEPYPDALPERRQAELRAPSAQPVWKLVGAGSVGSQTIMGIAHLQQLRRDEELGPQIAVWPFETRFAANLDAPIVFGEIYPGLLPADSVANGHPPDKNQVTRLAELFSSRDAEGRFGEFLDAPEGLDTDALDAVLAEEGWIVGLGRFAHAAAEAEASGPRRAGLGGPRLDYLRDPKAIYAESFRIVREEADLSDVPEEARDLAIRLVHACGMPEIVADLRMSPDAIAAGRRALEAGAPILTDAEMVAHGIIAPKLPKQNRIVCRLSDPRTGRIAEREETTRSAAQVDLWRDLLDGAIVAIGNAPTALFRLLEKLDESGVPRPALIIGLPVGFVGAAESKAELVRDPRGIPYITLTGRRGGSAMAAAAVNALASGLE